MRYTWDFSDGSGANGMVIDHTFHQPGTYTVMLYVQDANGLVGSTSQPIQIVAAATPVPTQPPHYTTPTGCWRPLTGTSITLAFQAEELTGFAGCNTYTGAYTTDGADLHISNLQVTQQACAPETMAQEQLYLAGLANAFRFSIADHQLTIVTGSPSLPVLLTYNAAPN
ncbi:MAG: META domain-containing protein [Anaerolineae bacterium]|nr:MAG: META domain-containing protein [Anaerolineae bacterium]